MARFDDALPFVLKHEGYFSDDERDPGGVTKWGISLRFLQEENIDINEDGVIDRKDVMELTLEKAKEIYYRKFWIPVRGSEIRDQAIATKILDMAVNLGVRRAGWLTQYAVNAVLAAQGDWIRPDGWIGPRTLGGIKKCDPRGLMIELCHQQAEEYRTIANKYPKLKVFLAGWLNRAYDVPGGL